MKRTAVYLVGLVLFLSLVPAVRASYITDIGHDSLKAQLGTSTPTGAGVRVSHVEAAESSSGGQPIFMPDPSHPEFAGKTIIPIGGNPTGLFSGHATEVGRLLYGTNSIAHGVTQIASYEAGSWWNSLYTASGLASTSLDRVANHSWVGGSGTDAGVGQILRLVDRQVVLNEYIQVAAMSNGPGDSPLLGGSAYNVISVGRTDGVHQQGSVSVPGDSQYGGTGRTVPTIVAPLSVTSTATPVVAAAAAILVQTGHEGGLTLSEGSKNVTGVGTIYNAEQSETVKAALMAGADRQTANTSTDAHITDYRSAGHETVNGLDSRYGAGQLNIYNSYRILAGGEQRSAQSGGVDIRSFGFDYGSIGGSSSAEQTASYFFDATANELSLFASLVWNLDVANTNILDTNNLPVTRLYNLDLSLFDVTNNSLVATSASTLDNTENLYFKLLLGNRYEMRVTTNESTPWDYALAWRIGANAAPVPIPPTAWLFISGALGLLLAARTISGKA
jgi:hypothetical protein